MSLDETDHNVLPQSGGTFLRGAERYQCGSWQKTICADEDADKQESKKRGRIMLKLAIYGKGGIGKTSLLKKLTAKVPKDCSFHSVFIYLFESKVEC